MILHYFKRNENKDKKIAKDQYKKILEISKIFINQNNLFIVKNYNTSFEIVTIFIIFHIKINLSKLNRSRSLKINEYLISIFVSDLDESLRAKGIGDMSIGKYVKSYVKKFYFRLSLFPKIYDFKKKDSLVPYFENIKIEGSTNYSKLSTIMNDKYSDLLKKNI